MAHKKDIYQKKDMVFPPPSTDHAKWLFLSKYLDSKIKKDFSCAGSRIGKIKISLDDGVNILISARKGFTINNIEGVIMGLFDNKFEITADDNNDKHNKKFTIKTSPDEVINYIREINNQEKNFAADVMAKRGEQGVVSL